MGQKTHPVGFRLGIKSTWKAKWFSSSDFSKFLIEDIKIRKFLDKKLRKVGLSRIEIERSVKKTKVILYVSKPGLVIGRGGSGIESLKKNLNDLIGKNSNIQISVTEVKSPFLSAKIIAEEIATQVERRMSPKRIFNNTIEKVMNAGAKGVKIALKGRISGQEIARNIHKSLGSVPLQTLSADVDFARATAFTKYGTIGIKVWIHKDQESNFKKQKNNRF